MQQIAQFKKKKKRSQSYYLRFHIILSMLDLYSKIFFAQQFSRKKITHI